MAKVRDLMSGHVVGVSTDTTIGSAVKLMKSMHVNLMPVLKDGRLEGIVLERDLDGADANGIVRDMMRDPLFVEESCAADDAARMMVERVVGRLPVVNNRKEMRCVGFISSTDIVKSMK